MRPHIPAVQAAPRLNDCAGTRSRPSHSVALVSGLTLALTLSFSATPATAAKPVKSTASTTPSTPLQLTLENYYFRYGERADACLGEDDELTWKALGELQPGESFTFTPQYPGCAGHVAAISVDLSWQGSQLELSSNAPDADMGSDDPQQKGRHIVAPTAANRAQLCMFPAYNSSGNDYTITLTNTGTTTATNIVLDGRSNNDWAVNFYNRCQQADADNDGWNDSLEHSIATLLYSVGYIDGVYQPYRLWGSNYLKAVADTAAADDEIDSSPVDFNDDGKVNQADVDEIGWYLGEGNGIAQSRISPNPSDPAYLWTNAREWRRYDLNGDGYVDQQDLDIVTALVDQPLPMQGDPIAPTARVLPPAGGSVAKGSYYQIQGHVWDNAAVTQVEYLVDGRVQCTATDPVPDLGSVSPFNYCWWQVPKRQGPHELTIRVYDGAGNVSTGEPLIVVAE